jgi:DNA-binding transcriptional LysR family regulator
MSAIESGLNFRQLEIFNSVVEEGSTTRSALKLGLSQPAVSRNVAQLEKDIGFDLFLREGNRLVPTEAALRLHAEARRAFDSINEVVFSTRNKEAVSGGSFRIAAVPSLSLGFLPRAISLFLKIHPDVRINVETRTSRMAMDLVANQNVDTALVSLPISHAGLKMELLSTPKAVCVMPEGHRLTSKEVVGITDLKDERLISMSRSHNSRHRLEELFASEGIAPDIRLETSTIEMACILVEEGLGVTIVNELMVERHLRMGLVMRPFQHAMHYAYAFAFPAKKPPTEITQIFVTHVKNYVAERFGN